MPFSKTDALTQEEWRGVFENIFRPTFELLGYDCIRSDVKSGAILQNIITNLHKAWLVLADLTDSKPNVFYELGIAHAITKRVIMASQRVEDCPSDLKPYGIIPYKARPTSEDTTTFQRAIKEALEKVVNTNVQTSPVSQFLRQDMHALEEIPKNPIAVMRCIKCGKRYDVSVGETTQSDYGIDAQDIRGRTDPLGIDHEKRHLCGHWECSEFLGLEQYPTP